MSSVRLSGSAVWVRETLHRQTTVAAMVFHGIKVGEDPRLTTMWAVLGQPLFSVAVPCFPAAGAVAPELAGSPRSPLCDAALALAERFYDEPPASSGDAEGGSEAEVAGATRWLRAAEVAELSPRVQKAEEALLKAAEVQISSWRRGPLPDAASLAALHGRLAGAALHAVQGFLVDLVPVGAGR